MTRRLQRPRLRTRRAEMHASRYGRKGVDCHGRARCEMRDARRDMYMEAERGVYEWKRDGNGIKYLILS
jgi:hypothetical protein